MSHQHNKIAIYRFTIEAISPLYFGGSETGKLIMDSAEEPILLGNSIAGALRAYLKQLDISDAVIFNWMGGSKDNQFLESKIYLSDGKIQEYGKITEREGTAIDPLWGSALKNHKYTLEYLSSGSIICFQIECEVENNYQREQYKSEEKDLSEDFDKIIGTWAQGFHSGQLRLGGQQNNGFGIFKLRRLEKKVFELSSFDKIEQYIFDHEEVKFQTLQLKDLPCFTPDIKEKVIFSMEGGFPYGVYQAFKKEDTKHTGLQKHKDRYYIPASSIKGLVKNEIRTLLNRFFSQEETEEELNLIFGSQNSKGRVGFYDMVLDDDAKPVKVMRFDKERKLDTHNTSPVYIKIDRITGGVIPGALKTQIEVYGKAQFVCELILEKQNKACDENQLIAEQHKERNHFIIFLLIYALRRIGSGLTPIGGRTVTGLGEFRASQLRLSGVNEVNITTSLNTELSMAEIEILKMYYDSFERRCKFCQV